MVIDIALASERSKSEDMGGNGRHADRSRIQSYKLLWTARSCHVLCTHRAVRRCPVLGQRERRIPQRKDCIIDKQNALNAPGYIVRVWAHYNTFRGAPFPHIMSQSEGICPNQSPNQTPMRPGQCHSCASQRHPDTMHNITPPHKGAAALIRTKNGKGSHRKIKSRNH